MKIRCGHVTNSSSSSFIIAYRNLPEFDQDVLDKYPFLKDYSSLIHNVLTMETEYSSAGTYLKTKEEFDKYMLREYGYKEEEFDEFLEEYGEESYKEIMDYINDGFTVVDKSIDYHDECLSYIIHELCKSNSENIKVLRGDC